MPDPSPAPLTPEELRELVELEKKATSAPWTAGDGGPKALYERCVILCSFGDSDTRILFTANHHFESEHDLALVSALRNAAPRLLSELAALREENERLRVQVRAQAAALDKGVQHVCDSMRKWRDALEASGEFERQVEAIDTTFGMIGKSSMLDRLIYGCEPLRTEKCPKHKGRWSGLPSSPNDCPHGCGLTGWLPAKPPAPAQEAREG